MINKWFSLHSWFSPDDVRVRPLLLFLCCIISLVLIAPQREALAVGVEILTPRSGATIVARNAETHLVLRQVEAGKSYALRVRMADAIINPIVSTTGDDYEYVHFRLPLKEGKNNFTIEPSGKQIEVFFKPVRTSVTLKNALNDDKNLFHREEDLPESCQDCHDLKVAGSIIPTGLLTQTSCIECHKNLMEKGSWKHSTTVNQQCLTCHLQQGTSWGIGLPTGNIRDFCLNCHTGKRSWLSRSFIHGPVSIGGCTLCHNPHGENQRYQLIAEGSLSLCIECHGDKENLISEDKNVRMKYVHGVISGAGCVVCHDPHATDQQFMLKKPINELCSGCHPEVVAKSAGHPVANHPVSASSERLRPGRRLTCTSCHDPHGSDNRLMLIQSQLGGRLCRGCHAR
jgi:predicted CXXCH cytochrome family protein